jgi:peptidoglycan-N-acetylglucosamine deacetylase
MPWIHGKWARILLKKKAKKYNALALTFDDGPGSRLTSAILDILAENNSKATFFLLGRNIAGREEIVKQIAVQGHEICSHGYDHLHYWKVSPIRAIKDIKRGWAAIDAALGVNRGKYAFRPPYGKLNLFSLVYLWIRRVRIVYWTLDSGDTRQLKPNGQRIVLLAKKTGGAVSLAHDFDRPDDSIDQTVLESVRLALPMAKERGMQILTCSQLLDHFK